MSSGVDSETEEWEREQMLRGTRQKSQHQKSKTANQDSIDCSVAKRHVNESIEKTTASIESIKRNMGSTRVRIRESEKRIETIKRQVAKLESSNPIFHQLESLSEPKEVLEHLERNKPLINELPHDQKEMIDLLERSMKEFQPPMDVDT